LKNRLEQMVTIGSASDDMQKKIELCWGAQG